MTHDQKRNISKKYHVASRNYRHSLGTQREQEMRQELRKAYVDYKSVFNS